MKSFLAKPKHAKQIAAERALADFLPYSSHVDETTIRTRDGDYMRMFKIPGVSFETIDLADTDRHKEELNTMLRSIGTEHVAIYTHEIRRRTMDRLESTYEDDWCRDFDRRYYDSFQGHRMLSNELYLTVLYRPNPSLMRRTMTRAAVNSNEDREAEHMAAMEALDDLTGQVIAGLAKYATDSDGIRPLSMYTHRYRSRDNTPQKAVCSEMLEVLNFIATGEWQRVRVPSLPLNEYLGDAQVLVGTETIALRSADGERFAQALDFKDYVSETYAGIMDTLKYMPFEYCVTQSFAFIDKAKGLEFLTQQERMLRNAGDAGISQIVQMARAKDQLVNGEFCMGEYHYQLMVFGASIEEVRKNMQLAKNELQSLGFLCSVVRVATDAAYFGQFPGNFIYRPRMAKITSRNFAAMSPFHNYSSGKRDGNPWGQALTMFQTPTGQPFYFNFHYSNSAEDVYDKKVLGNTRVIGASGTGKTALLNFLLAQSQKYAYRSPLGFTTVFFDKDEGAKIAIKRMGGKYLSIKNGVPSGMNPFQMENTPNNLTFLIQLVTTLAEMSGPKLDALDQKRVASAVHAVMEMDREARGMLTLLQNMTEGTSVEERKTSVALRLQRWVRGNELGWVFDNADDQIDFSTHRNYGFDGTEFLDNKVTRTPIAMYLLHRMEQEIDGRRFVYMMDEAWKWIDDPAFSKFAGDKQLTIRKQNGLGVFATQMPESVLESDVGSALIQQTATEIYLPNPKADLNEYIDGFKLSKQEFELIKNLADDSRMFLVKQGQKSAVCKLDLGAFDDDLAILSGSTDNVALMDAIIDEVGDDPRVWGPIFHERRKAIKAASRLKRRHDDH